MEFESSTTSHGIVPLDYKDALLRWSKSWAELADNSLREGHSSSKVEDLESDAGYASEGGSYQFYLGSKSCSVGSLEDCALEEVEEEEEAELSCTSDDDIGIPDDKDVDDVTDDEGEGLDVSIEMIGSECVLVNGYKPDELPCPFEATRDGMTPEVNLEYDHEDLIDLACRYVSHLAGRNEQNIRPKIYWSMKFAPEFEADQSDS